MKILANDYQANLPGATVKGTGGPARFASQFSHALIKEKNSYVGIVMANTAKAKPTSKRHQKSPAVTYYEYGFPQYSYDAITKAKRNTKPEGILKNEISLFEKIIAKEKPDVVFINGFNLRVWPLLLAAYKSKVPVVQKHAGIWHKEIAMYDEYFSNAGKSIMRSMEKDIAHYATKQIFLNTFSQAVFQKEVAKSSKSKQLVIPLPTAFNEKKHSKKKRSTIDIGVVARWDRIKNHQAILAVAEEIKKQKVSAKIHVITTIPDTTKDEAMKKRYRELIQVNSPRSNAGILAFFRKMDIAFLPSHFDVSPTVVLEAASQGVGTIISPTVGWVTAYRETGNATWIGNFSHPKEIVKKIQTLKAKKLSKILLNRFKTQHNPQTVFNAYIKLFHSLLNVL